MEADARSRMDAMPKIVSAERKESVALAAQVILNGGVVVYPTETVYGLGANALDAKAIQQVFELKQRNKSNPILVLTPTRDAIEALVRNIPEVAEVLMDKFWPGPLTIVFKASPIVSPILTARTGKLGIRLSSNEFCRELLSICKIPITSTSANLTGEPNTDSINTINRTVLDSVDLIVDNGKLGSPIPSTIVDVATGKMKLIREGVIPFADIAETIKKGN